MSIKTKKTLVELEEELASLRSFVIGMAGKDPDGEYRPEFVKKIKQTNQQVAVFEFSNKKDFLSKLL